MYPETPCLVLQIRIIVQVQIWAERVNPDLFFSQLGVSLLFQSMCTSEYEISGVGSKL